MNLNTNELVEHPLLSRVGRAWELKATFATRAKRGGKNAPAHRELSDTLNQEVLALVESVKEVGILEPLKVCSIDEQWHVVDGRHRLAAAKKAGLEQVPVVKVKASDAPRIIADTVAGRRHYSKGSIAFLAVLLNPDLLEQGPGRKDSAADSRAGTNVGTRAASSGEEAVSNNCALSAQLICDQFAVSRRTLVQAIELHRLLGQKEVTKRMRDEAEADVWAGLGLGGILAGLKSQIATGNSTPKRDAASAAWAKWTKSVDSLADSFAGWNDLDEERRTQARERLTEAMEQAPDEVKEFLREI